MRNSIFLSVFVTVACSFAHEYKSGEVPRLQVYSGEALAGLLRPCEFVDPVSGLRRDVDGRKLFVSTMIAEGPKCASPFTSYMLTLEKGKPSTRSALPSNDTLVGEDGTVLGWDKVGSQKGSFEFVGGPSVDGYLEVRRDKSGGPYYSAWHYPEGTEIVALRSRRDLARSSLRGPLFSKGSHHYLCGWTGLGPGGEGACDVFDSSGPGEDWRPAGRLLFGHHQVIDMDPVSDLALLSTNRDDFDPLLFTVDLQTWEWRYVGAGPPWFLLFMNSDPLARDQ
jgi:hypothetical protein